jgi:hypothetical protein
MNELFFVGTKSELNDFERAHHKIFKLVLLQQRRDLILVPHDGIIILGGTSSQMAKDLVDEISNATCRGALVLNLSGWDVSQHGWLCGIGTRTEGYDTDEDETNCEKIAEGVAFNNSLPSLREPPRKRFDLRTLRERAANKKRKKGN